MDEAKVESPFHFAGFTLDVQQGRLKRAGVDAPLRSKSFSLLLYLARNAGKVLSRDELLSAVWPNAIVSEDSLTQCVGEIRQVLGPAGTRLLRTVHRRGYVFMDDTESDAPASALEDLRPSPPPAAVERSPETFARADTISAPSGSLAVLPFEVLSGAIDPTFLDGVVNDVISRLARLRSFRVIARGSVFALRAPPQDPRRIGAALGVAYVVCGTAQARGSKVRMQADLVEVDGGTILWTEAFSTELQDFGALTDAVTERIATSVEFEITASERRRALVASDATLDAWQSYHRGLNHVFRFDAAETRRALRYFEFASERDPSFARAHAAKSFCHYFFAFLNTAGDRAVETRAALAAAARAMEVDERSPAAQWAYGRACWLTGNPDDALRHLLSAVETSPSFAHAHYMIGFIEAHHGDARQALDRMSRAEALSPFDPFLASVQITRAIALVRLGAIEEAADWAARAARQTNAYAHILCPAALILDAAGRRDEARRIVATIRRIDPDYVASKLFVSLYVLSDDVASLFRTHAPHVGL